MTTKTLDQLRSQIANLPEWERAELARELVISLDGPADGSVAQAWSDEIVRRISLVEEGDAKLLTRDAFRQRAMERLGRSQ